MVRVGNLFPVIIVRAEINFPNVPIKMHIPSLTPLEVNTLFTYVRITGPSNHNRRWRVAANAKLFPCAPRSDSAIIEVFHDRISTREWIFKESNAHLLDSSVIWKALKLQNGFGIYIFVEFVEKVIDNKLNVTLRGFIVDSKFVFSVDGDVKIRAAPTPTKVSKVLVNVNGKNVFSSDGTKKTSKAVIDFQSATSIRLYSATVWHDGTVSCNCKGWTNNRECRHLKSVEIEKILVDLGFL
jgi:hypothetical protein